MTAFCIPSAFWLWRRSRWRRMMRRRDANAAVIEAYGWFQRLVRWGGNVEETVVEKVQKARFSQHTLTQAEQAAVLARLQQEVRRCGVMQPVWKRPLYHIWFPVGKGNENRMRRGESPSRGENE